MIGQEEPDAELDARIEALHAFGPGTVEHLMGDLLGYWRRERSVVNADAYRLSIADEADQFESLAAITRLTFEGLEDQYSEKTGKKLKWPVARVHVPAAAARRRRRDGGEADHRAQRAGLGVLQAGGHRRRRRRVGAARGTPQPSSRACCPTSLVELRVVSGRTPS